MFVEGKILELYFHTERSLFAAEQIFVKKHDIGGTNFWPNEHYDMVC